MCVPVTYVMLDFGASLSTGLFAIAGGLFPIPIMVLTLRYPKIPDSAFSLCVETNKTSSLRSGGNRSLIVCKGGAAYPK